MALLAPLCACCGDLLEYPIRGCVCARCWNAVAPLQHQPMPGGAIDGMTAAGEYDGSLREIVHALKYQQRRSLAPPLASLMRLRGGAILDQAECAVPVPLHWHRRFTRGFNQAYELARYLDLPTYNVLSRTRRTPSQTTLDRAVRARNVRGAFALRSRTMRSADSIRARSIVLIDDVMTTGATLHECAWVLKQSGAARVYALTAACVSTRGSGESEARRDRREHVVADLVL